MTFLAWNGNYFVCLWWLGLTNLPFCVFFFLLFLWKERPFSPLSKWGRYYFGLVQLHKDVASSEANKQFTDRCRKFMRESDLHTCMAGCAELFHSATIIALLVSYVNIKQCFLLSLISAVRIAVNSVHQTLTFTMLLCIGSPQMQIKSVLTFLNSSQTIVSHFLRTAKLAFYKEEWLQTQNKNSGKTYSCTKS